MVMNPSIKDHPACMIVLSERGPARFESAESFVSREHPGEKYHLFDPADNQLSQSLCL